MAEPGRAGRQRSGPQGTGVIASLDGGGTKTALRWADAQGGAGTLRIERGCNPQDDPDWLVPIRAALASLPAGPVQLCLGIPGYGEIPRLDAEVDAALRALHPGCLILNDVALAYYGAFPDGGGVLVLSGTGSMAMARGRRGLVRVGGWGDRIGDEGSAFAIGRAALGLASQMIDGRRKDPGFAAALARRLEIKPEDGPFGLMGWATGQDHPRAAIASIARLIDEMAEAGEPQARAILLAAAGDLHCQARTAARLAGLPRAASWSAAGSVLRSRTVMARLSELLGGPSVPAARSALAGGLILAARAAGWPDGSAWRRSLNLPD